MCLELPPCSELYHQKGKADLAPIYACSASCSPPGGSIRIRDTVSTLVVRVRIPGIFYNKVGGDARGKGELLYGSDFSMAPHHAVIKDFAINLSMEYLLTDHKNRNILTRNVTFWAIGAQGRHTLFTSLTGDVILTEHVAHVRSCQYAFLLMILSIYWSIRLIM
jgi:hypothetical protein